MAILSSNAFMPINTYLRKLGIDIPKIYTKEHWANKRICSPTADNAK